MARKRRAAAQSSEGTRPADESRKRIRTYEDVADSDDEFHLNRDRILLEEEPLVKRQRKIQEKEAFLQPSDEEVLDHGSDAEEDEELGWGTARGEIYGADDIETEEQALEEEAEARRLQKKQLQSMSAADYGFDEDDWKDSNETQAHTTVTETLPEPEIAQDASVAERLKLLRTRYPEFEPLSKEIAAMNATVKLLAKDLASSRPMPRARTKYNAAASYLGCLAMYFALLTSRTGSAMPAAELREHDIMATLVECRALWQRTQTLPEDIEEAEIEVAALEPEPVNEIVVHEPKKSRKERLAEAQQTAANAKLAAKLQRTEVENAELDALLSGIASKKKRDRDETDYGEARLTAAEAEEKARRKKSLRFYTSQIAQKVNKRGAAGRTAGGDDDIPHRERLRDRQMRLNAEAEKRGKGGDELGGESDAEDAAQAREIRDADDDYYDLIAAKTAKKKSDKIAYGEAQKRAAEQGGVVVEEATVGADGKRKITYAIENNKGLTPFRKKDVRNPRVKKRKKFEEKTKKLGSQKRVYKGNPGTYGGELTGIKAGLVKSVKL